MRKGIFAFVLLLATITSLEAHREIGTKLDVRTLPLKPGDVSAVIGLLKRLIPDYADQFTLVLDPSLQPQDKDTFSLQSVGDQMIVTGNSAIGLSMGIQYYLKYFCNAHVSWSGDQLKIPQPLPKVLTAITIAAKDKYRHYQNVCTVSYSMVWWDWTRWEREIDWMALNGINMPLAFTAQETIWRTIYLELGFTEEEINEFFSGPAFLAWNRMGNMQGFGGPLSLNWHNQQMALQRLILGRMREFGMTTVLPAFAGRVLPAFQRIFPNASITKNSDWVGFQPPFCCTSILDPEDPLFKQIGSDFLAEYGYQFGTDHFYSADLFNEMQPPSSNVSYLSSTGKAVFESMTIVDSEAIWVMQGWIFVNDPEFWQPPQAKALLTSVPLGRMIVLDLEAEFHPTYTTTESFYGQPFIWCIIHNYGGVEGLYGSFDAINQGPFKGRSYPNSTMIGTGLTPEGIERNDVMYDLMNEMAWRDEPADIDTWIYNYTLRRYGKTNSNITTGWQYLKKSVYNVNANYKNHGQYIFNTRPSLSKTPFIWYDPEDVFTALHYFLQEKPDPDLAKQETYKYDVVDFTRQGLQLLFDSLYYNLTDAFKKGNIGKVQHLSQTMLNVLDDMDQLLSQNSRFTLEPWIGNATSWASTPQEEILYEYNARNQITLWGPTGEIVDYANKHWAGVVSGYFRPRWDLFFSMLRDSLTRGVKFNQTEYKTMVLLFVEEPFTFDNSLPTQTSNADAELTVFQQARNILSKYRYEISHLNDLQAIRRYKLAQRTMRKTVLKMTTEEARTRNRRAIKYGQDWFE